MNREMNTELDTELDTDREQGRIEWVKVADLLPPEHNARRRMDEGKLEDLARSIAADGVLQNLLAKRREDGRLEVVAGSRRLRASAMAVDLLLLQAEGSGPLGSEGLRNLAERRAFVPVRILTAAEAEKAEILQLVENLQREEMGLRDEIDGLGRLVDGGMTLEEVVSRTGLSSTYVHNRVLLRQCPEVLLDAVEDGTVQLRTAEIVSRVPGMDQREALAIRVLKPVAADRPLSDRETLEIVKAEYMASLADVCWPLDRPVAGTGPCLDCPQLVRRRGAGMVCGSRPCFDRKAEASYEERMRDWREDGREALPVSSAVVIYSGPGGTIPVEAMWVDLADPVPARELGHYGEVSWEDWLTARQGGDIGARITIYYCLHPRSGGIRRLVQKVALRLLVKSLATEPAGDPEPEADPEPEEEAGADLAPASPAPRDEAAGAAPGAAVSPVFAGLLEAVVKRGGAPWLETDFLRRVALLRLRELPPSLVRRWAEAVGCGALPGGDVKEEMAHEIARVHPVLLEGWLLVGLAIDRADEASRWTEIVTTEGGAAA